MAKRGRKRKGEGEGRQARDQNEDGHSQSNDPCPKISVFSKSFVSPLESPFSSKYLSPSTQTSSCQCATLSPAKRVMEMENPSDNMMASADVERVVGNILKSVQVCPASTSRYPPRNAIPRRTSLRIAARENRNENGSVSMVGTADPMTNVPITENFTSVLPPQIQTLKECNPAPPLERVNVTTDNFVPTVADPTSPVINNGEEGTPKDMEDRQEESAVNFNKKNESLSRFLSFNLSEMADLMDDGSSSINEVDFPRLYDSQVAVEGYGVKAEMAPTLRLILSKHGDIAANSSLMTMRSRSSFLECVCDIIKELQASDFTEVTLGELDAMRAVIGDMEAVNLEVGWLGKRLDDIIEAKKIVKQSSALKEMKNKNQQVIEEATKKLDAATEEFKMIVLKMEALREEIRVTQEQLAASKVEAAKIRGMCLVAKEKIMRFYKRSLMEGLL